MGIRLFREPELKSPILLVGWPGIGNIGLIAIDTLAGFVKAQEFGEIESWQFFDPTFVSIKNGLLRDLFFPTNKFCFSQTGKKDLLFFIAEKQPSQAGEVHAKGKRAYEMANLVLDVAEKFSCQRIYTSAAAVATIHHTSKPRVWAVPNNRDLIKEIRRYPNTVLMSEVGGRDQARITGLNGLLLGVAKKRGIEAICLMGEIPYYLQTSSSPYPKASISVLEVLAEILEIRIDLSKLDKLVRIVEREIEGILERFYKTEIIPLETREAVREIIEGLKEAKRAEPITEQDKREIMEHIEEFFMKGKENERSF